MAVEPPRDAGRPGRTAGAAAGPDRGRARHARARRAMRARVDRARRRDAGPTRSSSRRCTPRSSGAACSARSIVHTGQHTDAAMTTEIFDDLGLPGARARAAHRPRHPRRADRPRAGAPPRRCWPSCSPPRSSSPARRTRRSASCWPRAKLGVPVARLEAGLRENDWSVGEEVNRILLDTMADTLFAPTAQARRDLAAEGVGAGRVHLVGQHGGRLPAPRRAPRRRARGVGRFGARARRATCSSRCTGRPTSTTTSGSPGSSRRSPALARRRPGDASRCTRAPASG